MDFVVNQKNKQVETTALKMVSQRILNYGTAYGAFSGFAALCSGTVVFTGLMFPRQIISPTKPFSHVIFLISLCDFLASLGGSFGLPPAGTKICTTQAFLLLFFYPAAWIWTALLVYQIRCLLVYKRLWLKPKWMHMFCWTVVCICAFLPFTTNTYGQDDDLNQQLPCNYAGNPISGFTWSIATFGSILVASSVSMILCFFHVVYYWAYHGKAALSAREQFIYQTTRLYPLGMLICWIPYLATGVFNSHNKFAFSNSFAVLLILSTQYGTFLTVVFFTYCRIAVRQWRRFFGLTPLAEDSTTKDNISTANGVSKSVSSKSSIFIPPISEVTDAGGGASTRAHSTNVDFSMGSEMYDDFDDERLLYICRVDDAGGDVTMNDMFNRNSDFRNSQFRESDWRGSTNGL